jgi:hypothetical protein
MEVDVHVQFFPSPDGTLNRYEFTAIFANVDPFARVNFQRAEELIRARARKAIPALEARRFEVNFEAPSLRRGELVLQGNIEVLPWGDS